MELQAVTGQLYVVEGVVQEGTAVPGVLAQVPPSRAARGREQDALFVHLSLTGSPEETAVLAQDLLDAVSQRFYQSSGSVTAALRRALIEANELLLRLNLSRSGLAREGAITCAALHHGELFTLQTGEALAFLGHNFGVERLPPRPPDRITPLGRSAGIDVRYFHQRLLPGDMLLLADPRIAHLPTHTFEPALVDTEVELGLAELTDIVGTDSARLLLVEFTDDTPADLLPVMPAARTGEVLVPTVPTPRREVETAVLDAPTLVTGRSHQAADPAATIISRDAVTTVETTARKATAEAAMGLSRFTGWLADLLARLRPSHPTTPEEPVNWAMPVMLAVLIPLIVAVIVTSVYLQRGRVRRFAEIKQEMGQSLVLAEAADDTAAMRLYYNNLLALANEADSLRPGDAEVNRLRTQAMGELDRLDGVTRLRGSTLYTYDETVDLTAVVLRDGFNGGIYTLDANNSAVYQHDTSENYLTLTTPDPQRLVVGGQATGNHVVRSIVDILWRPQGVAVARDGLAMLDAGGALFTFYPNFADTRAVPLGSASEWRAPSAIATFDERLYILDPGAPAIWKYFPNGEALEPREGDRTIFLGEDAALDQAVDFDLYSEDASLIVAYADGRIRYYDTRSGRVQWDETRLLESGLNSPFMSPTAVKLVGRGLNASIFVADPGSGRIVQISRGGTVLAQYRATTENGQELFAAITDFAVAETPLRIFVTTGNILAVATQD